jgi:hypothetical protein
VFDLKNNYVHLIFNGKITERSCFSRWNGTNNGNAWCRSNEVFFEPVKIILKTEKKQIDLNFEADSKRRDAFDAVCSAIRVLQREQKLSQV